MYGSFLLATFLLAWITSGSRDTKLMGGLSLPSAPQVHADAPVGSQAGSDTGCAGCAGSGDGSEGGEGEGDGEGDGSEGSEGEGEGEGGEGEGGEG